MSDHIVEIHGAVKRYGIGAARVDALAGLDLSLAANTVTALIGPSGSGKSTLLHIIGGMDRADEGEVRVAGETLHLLSPAKLTAFRRHKIGFVFQAFNLMPNLTALENVVLPAEFAGVSGRAARNKAATLLDRVGLSARARHRPGQLSGGEQQRVAIARALVNGPALVIADEPTGNLDTGTGAEIIELLTSLAGEQTVIIATHDERIAGAADRRVYLSDGLVAVEQAGRP